MEPSTSPKTYWSALKSFHNNKKYLVFHRFFTKIDLWQKAELFNTVFARQCSIIDNGREIPSFLHPKTNKFLSNTIFTEKDTEKVMQNLDTNRSHDHDMISIPVV